jgi:hypothetical protein
MLCGIDGQFPSGGGGGGSFVYDLLSGCSHHTCMSTGKGSCSGHRVRPSKQAAHARIRVSPHPPAQASTTARDLPLPVVSCNNLTLKVAYMPLVLGLVRLGSPSGRRACAAASHGARMAQAWDLSCCIQLPPCGRSPPMPSSGWSPC